MARGTQHRKSSARANARVAAPAPKAPAKKSKGVKHARWEDQLFFNRLRLHAKWVFAFLALVFALSFVLLGVGSGSTGIGDALSNLFNNTSSSVASVSAAEKETRERPRDPAAWRALATALEQNDRTVEAIPALERYTALRPKDADALQELGSLHLTQADVYAQQYVEAQTASQTLAPNPAFGPASDSKLAKAFSDPLSTAVATTSGKTTSEAYTKYLATENKAVDVYRRLVALNPKDATNQYRLAQVAQTAGDTQTAITAYKRFLALAPDDSLAPAARQALKQLTPTATPSTSGG